MIKQFFSHVLRRMFKVAHDDSIRANEFSEDTRFSPYTAAMFPRF